MDIDFACTMCGKCCHDLRLPLTVSEAIAWLEHGDEVQILCEALPWPEEPAEDNLQAAQKRRRSFAAMSGSLPARIVVILAGTHPGPCPNLRDDMRCGIYEQRPLVCRIYPAEINPFIALTPAHKACPPDAWTPGLPPLLRAGKLVDAGVAQLIQQSRDADEKDVPIKQQVCAAMGIDQAAVSNEGFVAYSPDRADLLAALRQASNEPTMPAMPPTWHFVSKRRTTVDVLVSVGALSSFVDANSAPRFEYLGFSVESE
ncbi:putative zinc- or iron-chelating protein [Paraburkholderia sp. BL27I4N3]|uniref:YkgJ family cysteine cluster protein n=1 Tax=Paraburkholderia sp. BL27I4N3 TaxID=1938805 RepID=UPI000E250948|nr:YkgJ family cysteine cluster protein [Paraburkholderia sp. BL27I4N3]REE24214.1 putative zinc- or iron-chelating protein [Paraburkholderia sp. BL27I4N3]